MENKEISWDLSEIFKNVNDPEISNRMESLDKQSGEIVEKYKGKINDDNFSPQDLLELIKTQEKFLADMSELGMFCRLSFSANMTIPENASLKNKYDNFNTKIQQKLTFLTLEKGELLKKNQKWISDEILSKYKHNLEINLRVHPHKLSEIEEQIIFEKDKHGIIAWSELQSMWLNTRQFKVNVEGEDQTLAYGEANGLLTHKDSDTRISANKSIYGLLGKDEVVFSSALRNVCGDWLKVSKRRKYENPMDQSFIANDTTKKAIQDLMNAIDGNSQVYRRYLKIKSKLLGVPKLRNSDIMAPPPNSSNSSYNWDQARELVSSAYASFSKKFKSITDDMFTRNHIDASPRNGKRNGAFCSSWYKGKSAYMLQTFTGSLNDIYTLAHELGHAVHDYLCSGEQTYLNTDMSMLAAETASIFGELLLTDMLLQNSTSIQDKIQILTQVLDGSGQAAFQVSARVWFEQSLYDSIEKGEFLDGKKISSLWCSGRDRIYGDAVEWFEEMDWEWTMKPHYYIPNFRFYNYPYVYAQLFVYALYQIYKNEGEAFIPKFEQLLALGGSLSPVDLAKKIGLNVEDPEFWKLGIAQFRQFIDEYENLVNQL